MKGIHPSSKSHIFYVRTFLNSIYIYIPKKCKTTASVQEQTNCSKCLELCHVQKRRLDEQTQDKIRKGLTVKGASERAINDLWNLWSDDKGAQVPHSNFARIVQENLAPWQATVKPIKFERVDGGHITLPIGQLRPVLSKLCEDAEAFQQSMQRALQQNECLTPVFYSDECTAGNVLSNEKQKKAVLWYMSWLECFHLLKVPTMWICIAAVQTQCVQELKGGTSAVMTAILAENVSEELQQGFALPGGLHFKQSLKAFYLADMDAIRGTYSLKGSAGLRPCVLCDVLKKDSGLLEHEASYVDISASSGFRMNSDASIFGECDRMKLCRTRAQLELHEKATGIVYDDATLMFSKSERKKCRLHRS